MTAMDLRVTPQVPAIDLPWARSATRRRPAPTTTRAHPILLDVEAIVRRQDQERCASITSMIRHYVARRAK